MGYSSLGPSLFFSVLSSEFATGYGDRLTRDRAGSFAAQP
jgi:hypothetical protein